MSDQMSAVRPRPERHAALGLRRCSASFYYLIHDFE
jgi:hypothetical protein